MKHHIIWWMSGSLVKRYIELLKLYYSYLQLSVALLYLSHTILWSLPRHLRRIFTQPNELKRKGLWYSNTTTNLVHCCHWLWRPSQKKISPCLPKAFPVYYSLRQAHLSRNGRPKASNISLRDWYPMELEDSSMHICAEEIRLCGFR